MSDRLILEAFIATDRLQAMVQGRKLPSTMQGALVMVDLTGYTGSVEQAERQLGPTRGADVMTKAINRIFDRLICEIYRYGGVAVGFSGDAILAWFHGDVGLQATASAFAMQQSVAQQAEYPLGSTLKISFALKASIATGKVHRSVVGDPQIQQFDLLTGDAMNRLALVQRVTKNSDIVLDEECAMRLGAQLQIKGWIGDAGTGRKFAIVDRLTASGTLFDQPTLHSLPTQQLAPWILRPVYENLLATKGQFSAAIRQVVALFFKFHLPEAILAQDCSSEIDHYVCWVQRTLQKQNGYLIKLTIDDKGCYGLATFGAPQDSEDAPQRALTAALALQHPPSHLAFVDAIQIGISQGRMLAGSFGNCLRAGYDLLGHELTIANRLMSRAKAGEILVTEQIATNCQRFFKFQNLDSEMLKGSQQPVPLFLLSAAQTEIPFLFDSSKITIGREAELSRLQALCQSLPTSGLQAVRLVGLAGIGKTQLLLEMHRRAPQWGIQPLLADCERIRQQVAYYPWRQIIQQLLFVISQEGRGDVPFEEVEAVLLRQLGNRFEESTIHAVLTDIWGQDRLNEEEHLHGKAQERNATIAALIAALLHDRLALQPVIIMIEDAQWLDLPSFELLLNLKRTLAETPLLLLVSHHPASESRHTARLLAALQQVPDSTEIEINAFELSATRQLIESQLEGKGAPLLHTLLQAQTQGHPLAIEETIRTHQITGRIQFDKNHSHWTLSPKAINELRQAHCLEIDPASGEWQLKANAPLAQAGFGTPDQLQQMIFARFDLLNAELQLTLKIASVIGRSFNLPLLQAAHPHKLSRSTLRAQLAKLQQHDFWASQSTQSGTLYRFQHQLVQEGIYESMTLDERVAWHYAVGNGLATQAKGELEQLAWHFWRCRAEHPEEALRYVKQAAKQAQNYANHAALDFYNQALELSPKDVDCLKGKVETLHVLGRYDEEQAILQQLSTHTEASEIERNYLWGNYYVERENYPAATTAFQQVCQLAEVTSNSLQLARGLTQLGWVARKQNQLGEAQGFYEQAIVVFERLKKSDAAIAHAYSDALNGLGTLFRQLRNYPEAERYYQAALELNRQKQTRREEARTLNNLGGNCYYRRELEKARVYFTQSLHARRAIGDQSGEGDCLANLATICSATGEYENAILYTRQAMQVYRILDNSEGQIISAINLGIIYREIGCIDKAKASLEIAKEIAVRVGDIDSCNYVLSNLGLVLCDLDEFEKAISSLQSGLTSVLLQNDRIRAATFQSYLGLVYLTSGEFQQAAVMAEQAIETRSIPELQPLTADDRATLASSYLQTGRVIDALQQVEQVQLQLMTQDQREAEFPQRDWFICYQVLQVAQQEDAAQFAIQQAHEIVMKRGQRLQDPDLRQRYLNKIPLHRQIKQAVEQLS